MLLLEKLGKSFAILTVFLFNLMIFSRGDLWLKRSVLEGLTSWDICKKLAANGLVIPQIISGVNRCLADRNYRSSLSDWFSRKIGDKWFVRILSDEQSA